MNKYLLSVFATVSYLTLNAQNVQQYTTTEGQEWQSRKTSLSKNASGKTVLSLDGTEQGVPFRAWGTTFNELDWDAFNLLSRAEQDELMKRMFSPDGDLRFTHGRVSMNANDYARAWYSCDEVDGDFGLQHFNIEHDKRNIIPLARAAQRYQPTLQLFMSPWSPPSWMKINHEYCVLSSKYNKQDPAKDYLLYMDDGQELDPDEMIGYAGREYSDTPIIAYRHGKGYVVIAGNFTDESKSLSVKIGNKYLNIETLPHSFNTYVL